MTDLLAVKALSDWRLDVSAAPFDRPDSDQQTFDRRTDFMLQVFNSPAIFYHHGVMPGKKDLQKTPEIIGKTESVEIREDGVHIIVLLDQTKEWAKRVWEAAKNGLAVASSDSISHLARLEVNGKPMMYEKNKKGRISVWPLAGVSLWDRVDENFKPASHYALALPAMKAIYRENNIEFPALDTHGDSEAEQARRAKVKQAQAKARLLLNKK